MKTTVLGVAATLALFAAPGLALAQSNADRDAAGSQQSFTHGESKRCGSLSGTAKEQCDKEEGNKTQGADNADASRAATGASTSEPKGDSHFTHGESKHCEQMTGAAKDECDRKEATK